MARTTASNGASKGTRKIAVLHATSPGCWWSWGYEGTLNRVRLLYGGRVAVKTYVFDVYGKLEDYLRHNGMDAKRFLAWQKESAALMGVPVEPWKGADGIPASTTAATLAALAARRQGEAKGNRFFRALTRELIAVGRTADRALFVECAREAKLDLARFEKDLADKDGLTRDMEEQEAPHMPLGFYNVAVTDGERTVLLNHAFEPDAVEEAIDYLSGGTLAKTPPTDIEAYLRENGPAPPIEIARVFGLPHAKANASLATLAKKGQAKEVLSPSGALCFAPA